ncbi:MAG: RNA-directed DNA polymerase [Parvibaculum sp.]|nr:RNA-directed DNA polymerase [Parvibaculum sp.]MBO6693669.1 RNA-directed DNA polymerase [Parvibaculum sp.]
MSDRAIYHGLAWSLFGHFDPLIPWYVFSHRSDPHRSGERYMFRNGVGAWRDFVGASRSALKPNTYLLSTDLANYFEHIDLEKLRQRLLELVPKCDASSGEKSAIRQHINFLLECLKTWAFEPHRGLPQNRDASSFLANIYMMPIDEAMRGKGYEYFRYMDDVKVVCSGKDEARKALKDFILELRKVGLSVNSKKTKICAYEDREKIDECLDSPPSTLERLDTIWRRKNRTQIARTFPEIMNLALSLINEGHVESREFRFCLNRLILLANTDDFSVPDEFFDPFTDALVDTIGEFSSATKGIVDYLSVVKLKTRHVRKLQSFLCDPNRSIYTWQNYLLWLMLAESGQRTSGLMKRAKTIIRNSSDTAERAGATVYVGALGNKEDRQLVAKRFFSLESFLGQRCALVALQELPFSPWIKKYVAPFVRSDLIGCYRALRAAPVRYFCERPKASLTDDIDREKDYA